MKKTMILLLCMLFVLPMMAQDEGDTCEIDLAEATKNLIDAQAAADDGDNPAALALVSVAQEQLAVIVEQCASGIAFERSYTSPDEKISFRYPDGWVFDNIENEVYFVADSAATTALIESNVPEFPSGTQLLFVFIVDKEDMVGGTASFDAFVYEFTEGAFSSDWRIFGPIKETEVGGLDSRLITVHAEGAEATMYIVDVEPETALIVGGFSAPDELDDVRDVLDAFIRTVRYRNILVPSQFESTSEADTTQAAEPVTVAVEIAPPLDLNYGEAVLISDLIEEIDKVGPNMNTVSLSPDGTMLAWFDDESMCLYRFEVGQTGCYSITDGFRGAPIFIKWSPNSDYVAFHQNFLQMFLEPDIWLFDAVNERFINATDDGIEDWRPGNFEGDTPAWLDYLTTWGPDNHLYFIRQIDYPDDDTEETGIYRLNPQTGEVELVKDISYYFGRFTTYDSQEFFLDGAMSVSPDGKQMAVLVRPFSRDDRGDMGVWLIDLTDESPPTQLVSVFDLAHWQPQDIPEDVFGIPYAVAWSANGAGLYVQTMQRDYMPFWYQLFYVDVASEQVTPLSDLSMYTRESMARDFEIANFALPSAVTMIPNTGQILIGNRAMDTLGLSTLNTAGEQESLYRIEEGAVLPAMTGSASSDGKVLLMGYLFMLEAD